MQKIHYITSGILFWTVAKFNQIRYNTFYSTVLDEEDLKYLHADEPVMQLITGKME